MKAFENIWNWNKGLYDNDIHLIKDCLQSLGLYEHLNNLDKDLFELDKQRYINLIQKVATDQNRGDLIEDLGLNGLIYC
jgi:hypothetical protein